MSTIADHLDGLSHPQRLAEVRSLGRKEQARLFEAARGVRPISLVDLVPAATPAMREVVHHGRNTLPAFNHFAKVFVRPDGPNAPEEGAAPAELWGYNRNTQLLETIIGPGYYVAEPARDEGEVLVNYLKLPPRAPNHWPPITSNSRGLSLLVYAGMQDVLRGVSSHVTIGRAYKGGRAMSAWFVLCREG